ncbi:DsbA family oxidoreductase [Myxococcota bacterium]|nr:DsbA family oxidoreductase [Myxococcota bacterium]
MKIQIWSDVICPWCGVGAARLKAALAQFEHRDDVEVVHRSFQLDPSYPLDRTEPAREMLRKKIRANDAQLTGMFQHIESLAAADGLSPYRVGENHVGNTRRAHELLAFAADQGLAAPAWDRLYRAYFGEGRSIFTVEALLELAGELGLDVKAAEAALREGRYTAQVEQDGREAQALGARGVPFVVIDGRLGVSGAQPVETFLAAMRRAWDLEPTPRAVNDAPACGPDGCEIPTTG